MAVRLQKAGVDPKNTTGADIEKAVNDSLKAQGINTTAAGTTSSSGTVTITPSTNPCGKLDDLDTEKHEGVHKATQEALEKQHGKNTPAFRQAWSNAKKWVDDEVNSYAEGSKVNQGFLDECKNKFGVTSPKEPPCNCPLGPGGMKKVKVPGGWVPY